MKDLLNKEHYCHKLLIARSLMQSSSLYPFYKHLPPLWFVVPNFYKKILKSHFPFMIFQKSQLPLNKEYGVLTMVY